MIIHNVIILVTWFLYTCGPIPNNTGQVLQSLYSVVLTISAQHKRNLTIIAIPQVCKHSVMSIIISWSCDCFMLITLSQMHSLAATWLSCPHIVHHEEFIMDRTIKHHNWYHSLQHPQHPTNLELLWYWWPQVPRQGNCPLPHTVPSKLVLAWDYFSLLLPLHPLTW